MASEENKGSPHEDYGDDDEVAAKNAAPVPWYKQLMSIKDTIIIVLTPLIFLPIFAFTITPVCITVLLIIVSYI